MSVGPLAGVRVVEISSSLGSYAGRLFADLGAEVIMVEDAVAPMSRTRGLTVGAGLSAKFLFSNAGKLSVTVNSWPAAELLELLESASILITSDGPGALSSRGLSPKLLRNRYPHLVHLAVSPFGQDGPWAERPATDLTLLAAGGLLLLAGDPGRYPVRAAGEQSAIATGLHAAVGGLIALLVAEESGDGQTVDVSAQEAIAHSLENAAQFVDLEGVVRSRVGGTPREAGTGLFACADGLIYLVAGLGGYPLGWSGLVAWIGADGSADALEQLRSDRWQDPAWRKTDEAIRTFRDLFVKFSKDKFKKELYESGQSYGVSVSPVSTPTDLLENVHLASRDFFVTVEVDGEAVSVPGSPYRFRGLDVRPRSAPSPLGKDTKTLLDAARLQTSSATLLDAARLQTSSAALS